MSVRVTPGHPDGAAGLKPLGNFYLFQASIAAIPAIYLGAWVVLIPALPALDYGGWESWFLWGLLPVAIAFEVLAFIWPMVGFHHEMKMQKLTLLDEADQFTEAIRELQIKLPKMKSADEVENARRKLESLGDIYRDREEMPTWPIDQGIRRRFTLSNGILILLPIASKVLNLPETLRNIIEKLGEHG